MVVRARFREELVSAVNEEIAVRKDGESIGQKYGWPGNVDRPAEDCPRNRVEPENLQRAAGNTIARQGVQHSLGVG